MTIKVQPEIWYPCPFCGLVFIKKSTLNTHICKSDCVPLDLDGFKLKFLKPK